MYLLYRILDECQPTNILELGWGQTTKMTSQYANMTNTQLTIIESDETFIKNFSNKLNISKNISILNIEIEEIYFKNNMSFKFKNLENHLLKQKFDLIIIDAPQGYSNEKSFKYSRINSPSIYS